MITSDRFIIIAASLAVFSTAPNICGGQVRDINDDSAPSTIQEVEFIHDEYSATSIPHHTFRQLVGFPKIPCVQGSEISVSGGSIINFYKAGVCHGPIEMALEWTVVETKCPFMELDSLQLQHQVDAEKENVTVVATGIKHFPDICSNGVENNLEPLKVKLDRSGNYHILLSIFAPDDRRYEAEDLPDGFFMVDLAIDDPSGMIPPYARRPLNFSIFLLTLYGLFVVCWVVLIWRERTNLLTVHHLISSTIALNLIVCLIYLIRWLLANYIDVAYSWKLEIYEWIISHIATIVFCIATTHIACGFGFNLSNKKERLLNIFLWCLISLLLVVTALQLFRVILNSYLLVIWEILIFILIIATYVKLSKTIGVVKKEKSAVIYRQFVITRWYARIYCLTHLVLFVFGIARGFGAFESDDDKCELSAESNMSWFSICTFAINTVLEIALFVIWRPRKELRT